MKMAVFWDIAPCSLVKIDRRFKGAYCLHHQVNFYQTTRRNNPEDKSSSSSPSHMSQQVTAIIGLAALTMYPSQSEYRCIIDLL
jgi:hypothetical protein